MGKLHVGILIGALALFAGCPGCPPADPPNHADGADAIAPPPAPAPDFGVACANGARVCPTFDKESCAAMGMTMSAAYRTNLAAATDCPSVRAADPGASSGGTPIQHGR